MKKQKITIIALTSLAAIIFSISVIAMNNNEETTQLTSGQTLSNKKIGWGIKRNDNHEQPDLGKENKKILEENQGIAMGNNEKKYIYLTFDEGYEAGYTDLKHFFISKNFVSIKNA